jgi:hypothetical protein
MADTEDLLNRTLTDTERQVLSVHDGLKQLLARADLAPCVRANARFALAATWQIVTDLGLRFEQDDGAGV